MTILVVWRIEPIPQKIIQVVPDTLHKNVFLDIWFTHVTLTISKSIHYMKTILEVWRIEPMSLTLFQFIPVTLLGYQCNLLTCELKTEYQNWLFYRKKGYWQTNTKQ